MSRTAAVAQRPKRTPIGSRGILSVTGKEPGYTYRIVNDTGDRVQQFLEAGYELVESSDVKVGDNRVDKASAQGSKAQVTVDKQGSKGFLMRIKDEWYEEDQKAKQVRVKALEDAIKNPSGADYGSVTIEREQ